VKASLKSQQLTCGECVGFCTEILKDKKLCKGVGIIASDKPCKQFKPDSGKLSTLIDSKGTFGALAELMNCIPEDKLRLVGAAFMREHRTRLAGYNIGQRVYVRYRGMTKSNYLSNFMLAYILFADNDMIRVTSKDGKCCMTFCGNATDAIISYDAFQPLKEKMVKSVRYVDPNVQRLVSKRIRCEEEYELGVTDVIDRIEIVTIDRVFKESGIKKNKTNAPNDLVAIVNAIESGFDVKAVSKKKKQKSDTTLRKTAHEKGVYSIDVNG